MSGFPWKNLAPEVFILKIFIKLHLQWSLDYRVICLHIASLVKTYSTWN